MGKDRELYQAINEGIINERLNSFRRNLELNLPFIRASGGLVAVVPLLKKRNVVIIGSGPSLKNGFESLRSYQNAPDLVYMAADMALKPLLAEGIRPHFVISCETRPVDFFGGCDTERIHLLAFSCMSSVNLRRWKGPVSFYNWIIEKDEYKELWDRAGLNLGSLATGALVTTQAVSLALGCGISSLMLAGNDLAFKREYYVRGTATQVNFIHSHTRFKNQYSFEMDLIRRRGEYMLKRKQETYMTDAQFLAAKEWLEELFNKSDVPVYDSSVPGCSESAVAHIDLEEYCRRVVRIKRKKRRRR